MKKIGIVKMFSVLSVVAGGAFVLVNSLSKSRAKTERVEAAVSGNRYIAGSFNSWNSSGLAMTKVTENSTWYVSREFAKNDEFKVTDGTWDYSWGSYSKNGDTADASKFGGSGNIVCNVAGTYTIIINNSNDIFIHAGALTYQSGKVGWVVAFNNSGLSSFSVATSIKMDAGTGSNYAEKTGISMNAGAKFQIAYSDGYGFTSSGWKTGNAGEGFTKDGDIFVCTNIGTVDVYGYIDGEYKMSAVYHGPTSLVIFDMQNGTGGSANVTATLGSAMPSITLPTREGYSFGGYFTEVNGGGTKYYNADGSSAKNWDKTDATTLYAYWTAPTGRYIVGDFGECSWGVEGATLMSAESGEYVASVALEFGDTLKCSYFNGTSLTSYFGYSNTSSACGAFFCFTNDEEDNLVCYAKGTYIFYFTDQHYGDDENIKLSIEIVGESRTAEQLAAKLMSYGPASMPSDGSCGSKFATCKEMFLTNLDATEKSIFEGYVSSDVDQFKNAYLRYVAWAAALGEQPWEAGKVAASNFVLQNGDLSNNSIIVITIISLVSVSSICALLVIKKRKATH